jgi:hypothetical protein
VTLLGQAVGATMIAYHLPYGSKVRLAFMVHWFEGVPIIKLVQPFDRPKLLLGRCRTFWVLHKRSSVGAFLITRQARSSRREEHLLRIPTPFGHG